MCTPLIVQASLQSLWRLIREVKISERLGNNTVSTGGGCPRPLEVGLRTLSLKFSLSAVK